MSSVIRGAFNPLALFRMASDSLAEKGLLSPSSDVLKRVAEGRGTEDEFRAVASYAAAVSERVKFLMENLTILAEADERGEGEL